MPVTILTGPETSIQNVDNNPRDIMPVEELEPNVAPLTVLMAKLPSQPAENPKIEWLENERMPRITTLSASAASNATAFGVAADIFRVGDVIRFTAGGWAALVSATAAGAITAAKVGGTAQATAANAAEIFLVNNANSEGSTIREIKHPQLVTASNYCQIIRTPFGLTRTEQKTTHYSGDERARLQKYHGIEHARDKEEMYFFGARDITGTPATQRVCGGIKEFLSTNVSAAASPLTEANWQTFLKTGFRYGSRSKVAFCSPTAIGVLEGYARSNIQTASSSDHATVYGITMRTYVSGQGNVDLISHVDWQDSSVYGGYLFLVDMDAVKKRDLDSTHLRQNIHAPDYDGFKDEYLFEGSLQVTHERRHALLTTILT